MHFPKSAVLIASIQGLAAFTAATSFAKYPRAAGGAAITSTTAEKAVSMQDVPSCAEIFAIHPNHTDTLQRTTCYTTAISIEEAQAKEVTARSADNTVYGPYCDNTGYAAGAIDATTLCQSIPSGWTLPPAYGSGSCACETWSIGSAAFAFCNCDTCNSIYATTSLNSQCNSIRNNCISRRWNRGYLEAYNPNTFWSLYGNGGSDPSPQYTACY